MQQGLPKTRLILGLVVSVIALAVIVVRVDLDEVIDAFRTANYSWLLLATIAAGSSVALRAQRWRLICKPVPLTFSRAFGILSVGAALTALLPLRLGDFVRAYLVGDMEHKSKAWALTTVVFERVLDIVALLVILGLLLPFVSLPSWAVESTQILVVATIAGMVLLCAAWFGRSFIERRLVPLERVRGLVRNLVDGLAILSHPRQLTVATLWSGAIWLSTCVVMWATMMAFGIESSPSIAMLLVVVSAVTVAVPLSPSAVGVYHAAIIETLLLVSTVSTSTATSIAITSHALLFAPPVICGFVSFWLVPGIAERMLMVRRGARATAPTLASSGTLPPG